MKNILLSVAAAALVACASAQTAPNPTPAQAQKATAVTQQHLKQAQTKTTNNLSRYQRTECARKHGTITKNAKGNLVCVLPKK